MKITQKISELLSGHDFPTKISKRHNSVKSAGGVTILALCTSPDSALYLKYLKGFGVLLSGHDL